MSQKDSEHIIDYINRKTVKDPKAEYWRLYKDKSVKDKVDKTIFKCNSCSYVWSKVPRYIDSRLFMYYPQGIVPKLGKKEKTCPLCQ